jgi:hypothetical protein
MALFVHRNDIVAAVTADGSAITEKQREAKGKRRARAAANLIQINPRVGINQNGRDRLGKCGVPHY